MFLVILALLFYLFAYFADTLVDEWPRIRGYAQNVRGLVDDVTMGDPNKIVHYQGVSGVITEKGHEFANVKFAISGYVYFGGLTARNAAERAMLDSLSPGSTIMVYYDPANPTITVMGPTYLEAQAKMKGQKTSYTKTKSRDPKDKRAYLPGFSRPVVDQIRIGSILVGTVFLILGARGKREDD
jgi:hypothetical protein